MTNIIDYAKGLARIHKQDVFLFIDEKRREQRTSFERELDGKRYDLRITPTGKTLL